MTAARGRRTYQSGDRDHWDKTGSSRNLDFEISNSRRACNTRPAVHRRRPRLPSRSSPSRGDGRSLPSRTRDTSRRVRLHTRRRWPAIQRRCRTRYSGIRRSVWRGATGESGVESQLCGGCRRGGVRGLSVLRSPDGNRETVDGGNDGIDGKHKQMGKLDGRNEKELLHLRRCVTRNAASFVTLRHL